MLPSALDLILKAKYDDSDTASIKPIPVRQTSADEKENILGMGGP